MAKKNTVKEDDILKALNELEDAVTKGDTLEEQDPEGGFSTEGTPLSGHAAGKAPTMKSNGDKDLSKMLSASDVGDDNSSDYGSEMKKQKSKTKKAMPPADDSASSDDSSDDGSPADDSDSDDDSGEETSKSLREAADEDETMHKAIEVSDFLESFVDQMDSALARIEKSLGRQLQKSFSDAAGFNTRLAKAVVTIGKLAQAQAAKIDELENIVKSFAGMPVSAPRGKAVLSKADITPSPVGEENAPQDFTSLKPDQVVDWMISKGVDPLLITNYELNHFNPAAIPSELRKALVHDLVK